MSKEHLRYDEVAEWMQRALDAESKLGRVTEAFRKYSFHKLSCVAYNNHLYSYLNPPPRCDCGYVSALAELPEPPK